MTYEEKIIQESYDPFYAFKTSEKLPLIGVIECNPVERQAPIVTYDKWKLFAAPFISISSATNELKAADDDTPNFIINFPLRRSENGTHLNSMLFVFSFKGIVIDSIYYHLPPLGTLDRLKFFRQEKWWLWGRPREEEYQDNDGYEASFGWAPSFSQAMSYLKIQIYG